MQALRILLISISVALIETNSSVTEDLARIANGEDFVPEQYPYVVGFEASIVNPLYEQKSYCTGTLISAWFVLTAAHCTDGRKASHIKIYLNTLRGKSVDVEKIYQHKSYVAFKRADLSLLKLKSTFSSVKKYAIIGGDIDDLGEKGLLCKVIGFGKSTTQELNEDGKMTDIILRSGPKGCAFGFDQENEFWKENLCAVPNEKMPCQGDSGGPSICNGIQYGVTSSGYDYLEFQKHPLCGSNHTLTIHQYLKIYKKWMDDVMNGKADINVAIGSHQKACMMFVSLTFWASVKIIFH